MQRKSRKYSKRRRAEAARREAARERAAMARRQALGRKRAVEERRAALVALIDRLRVGERQAVLGVARVGATPLVVDLTADALGVRKKARRQMQREAAAAMRQLLGSEEGRA